MSLLIGFAVFPGVIQLDFTGPHEVLAKLADARCEVLAHTDEPIVCAGGLRGARLKRSGCGVPRNHAGRRRSRQR